MAGIEEKLKEAREILSEWVDKQWHERCWYYPDIFKRLANILDVDISREPMLPPVDEFRRGCERYQEEEYKLKNG